VIEKYRLFKHVSIDTKLSGWFPPLLTDPAPAESSSICRYFGYPLPAPVRKRLKVIEKQWAAACF